MACGEKYMQCIKKHCWEEVCVNNVVYKIKIQQDGNCADIYASPCTLPSAVFQVAKVCELTNKCVEFDYYEAQIYSDPVVTIIDCDLCQLIRRALEYYLDHMDIENCRCNNGIFGGLF